MTERNIQSNHRQIMVIEDKFRNDQIWKHPLFKSDLELITQTRVKNPSKLKLLHAHTQTFIQRAQEKASVVSFSIIITYPLDKDYIESWVLMRFRISEILKTLYQFPIYSLLLTIEIHKNKNKDKDEKKRRLTHETRLKGRPHLHMCLMLYNDFLCPSLSLLEESLQGISTLNFDLQVQQLVPDDSTRGLFNIKNWFIYCLKEAKDQTSQRFLKKYLNITSSSFLYSGHKESFNACANLTSIFNQCDFNLQHLSEYSHMLANGWPLPQTNSYNQLPFVPQTSSEVLKVTLFLDAMLKHLNIAIWPDKIHLCKLKQGAKATWEEFMELSELYTFIIKQFPIKTQELLMQSRAFNIYTRDYKKLNFSFLPQVTIAGYLVELLDGIYNLRTTDLTPHSDTDLGLVSCSSFWPNTTFQDLPWPKQCFDIISRLRFVKEPNVYYERGKIFQIEMKTDYSAVIEFAFSFSNIFRPKQQNDRVLFLEGPPGAGKLVIIELILRSVLHNSSIGIFSNVKNEYQFTQLKNKIVGIANEFSPEYINLPDLKLLLEGAPMNISEKFMPIVQINTPGTPLLHMILISNDNAPMDPAIKRRIIEFYLHFPLKLFTRQEQIEHHNEIKRTAFPFVLLMSAITAQVRFKQNPVIPMKWRSPYNKLLAKIADNV